MAARIHVIPISHPARAAVAMLRHKRIPYRAISLMPGLHPMLVRLAGFERHTVPALELADGRKVQGSREIARLLDELRPDPPLFPTDPGERAVVAKAERWGEQVLQPVPRRLFRYLMLTHADARVWLGREILHLPAAEVLQWALMPAVRALAAISHSDEPTVRETIARLPELLDHADALVADGVIAGEQPNAADYQVLSGVRVLLEFEDLSDITEGRPSAAAARRLFPDWEGPAPRGLPPA